jgi:3-oxoacyl-[acyl-carrier protein] reductase
MLTLNGRTAVVTGGSGLVGYQIVQQFLEEGMNVATFHSRQEKAEMTKGWLKEHGSRLMSFSGDIVQYLENINEKFGGIDVLVCGQGWPPDNQEMEDISKDYWNVVLTSNLTASFYLIQKAIPYLKRSRAPRIIFLTSCEARTGGFNDGLAYTAAKGGVISLTYSTARRLALYGITVNAVAMGGIYNKPYPVGDEGSDYKLPDYAGLQDQIPLGRLGKPEDICAAVCYLASEEAGFVTGEVLNVNGGLFMG